MATYAGKPSSFYASTGGVPQEGAWYSGQRYLNGQLLAPGEYEPGKLTSNETISQTSPDNVAFVQQQRELQANQIQPLTNLNMSVSDSVNGLNAQIKTYRTALEQELSRRSEEAKALMEQTRARENEALAGIDQQTQPFMEEMSQNLRQQYKVEEDVQARLELARQTLNIYNEVEALIEEQKNVTGLASVRNPRVQDTIEKGMARIASHQAALASLDGNIALSNSEIDRAVGFVQADRQQRISYYNTILDLTNRDILNLDEEQKNIAEKQISLLEHDLIRAEESADTIKDMMLDPDKALMIARAGVTFNDSIEEINSKLARYQYSEEIRELSNGASQNGYIPVADPSIVPEDQLITYTDAMGKKHYYRKPVKPPTQTELDDDARDWAYDIFNNGSAKVKTEDGKDVTITAEDMDLVTSMFESAVAPQFSATIGTVFTDSYGRKWQFTSRGWVRI